MHAQLIILMYLQMSVYFLECRLDFLALITNNFFLSRNTEYSFIEASHFSSLPKNEIKYFKTFLYFIKVLKSKKNLI